MEFRAPAKRVRAPAETLEAEDESGDGGEHGREEETQPQEPVTSRRMTAPLKHSRSSPQSPPSVSVKRKRFDNAQATLAKPFRSPLLVRRKVGSQSPTTPPKPPTATVSTSPTTPAILEPPIPARNTLSRTLRAHISTASTTDPEIAALTAQVTKLRTRLKDAQTRLSMSQQALALESLPPTHKGSDERLEELTGKWRGAARQGADYLFGVAGDKVNRMGGARLYFEREKERQKKWADDADDGGNGWPDGEAEGDHEDREERKRRLMAEYDLEYPTRSRKEVDIAQTDDDHFTMEMMLKMMNIDFNIIGFDPDRQCWRD